MDEYTAGYIVGLFVGEGTFTGDKRQPYIGMKLHVDDEIPLLIIRDELGGKIYGPYEHDGRRYRMWKLHDLDGIHKAIAFFDKYLPMSLKRKKYEAWKSKYHLQ